MSDRRLEAGQLRALQHVTAYAQARGERARKTLDEVLAMADLSADTLAEAAATLQRHARVALHFHPDRPDARTRTVAEGLLEDGIYRSQFETGLSNGSLSAFPGGSRDRWEERMFGGAYHAEGTLPAHRPTYGALDLLRPADGPAPRFGSCYLLLATAASARSTFCWLDSHLDPPERGTYAAFDEILAALFVEAFTSEVALGERDVTPRRLIERLRRLDRPYADPSAAPPGRRLNHYVEAQVHGAVRLLEDAETLVADPSFRGTDTGRTLEALCARHAVELRWHAGFVLAPGEVPTDFRGPRMPSLAARIAVEGRVDAAAIGRAARDLKRDPAAWADRGSPTEVLQELKLLWHVLVRFGRPSCSADPSS